MIEEDIYAKELSILIDIAIEQMPEQRRRIFKMSRKEGLSNEEISQKLQINKRTVENHVTQALADLREVVRGAFLLLF
ncbi:sigma-70 family RNA polymerase sigma factor [Parabacteroides goldsteinii]|uniref:sigma-70 family RNA polymerase sigma factor n=1 Tax=Parabacteroides goldsteinii TaxID=328812 RepID=UPI003467750A